MKRSKRFLLMSTVTLFLAGILFAQAAEQTQSATNTSNADKTKIKVVHGNVVDAQGKPVGGATVEHWENDISLLPVSGMKMTSKTTTGADGGFDIEAGSSGVEIAYKPGMSLAWRNNRQYVSNGDTNMVMTQPGVLAGVVKDEQDKPVAGAKVSVTIATVEPLFLMMRGMPLEEKLNAISDASGKFRIEGVPTNSSAAFKVRAPGKTLQTEGNHFNLNSLPYHAGQENITLIVEPAGVIEGRIVMADGSQPVPIASVTASLSGSFYGDSPEPVTSSADGTFRFTDAPAGAFKIAARWGTSPTSDWVAATVNVTVEAGKTNSEVRIHAARGALVEIQAVSKADHTPVTQATAGLYAQSYGSSGISDSNGLIQLSVPAGEYQLSARAEGWNTEQTTITAEVGKTNRLQIELTPARKLTGIVRDPNGKPVPGLPVRVVGRHGMTPGVIRTDENGKFEFDWQIVANPGMSESIPCLFVQDVEHNLAAAENIEEDTVSLDLKLAPSLAITGRAECDGKPINNPTAALIFWTGNTGIHLTDLFRKGGAPGQYEIPCLPTGRKYGVVVSATGYGRQPIYDAATPDTEAGKVELNTAELKLANLKVAGQVVNSDDKPVPGTWVSLSGDGQPNGNTRTDRQGRFTFEHVCDGPVRLFSSYNTPSGENTSGNISTEGGDTNVLIKLGENRLTSESAKNHKLSGIINGTNGQPVTGVEVALFPQNGNRSWIKTDANGLFKLTWSVQPWQEQNGNPVLVARYKELGLSATEEIGDETTNVTLQLKPAFNVSGKVEKEEKGAIPGARVGIWFKAENTFDTLEETTADAEGQFQIKCLPFDANYMFYASAKGYGCIQANLKNETENQVEYPPISVVLKPANLVLAGQVIDSDEKPISGANVQISGDGQPNESLTTDKQGRFKFKVCDGSVRLFANSQAGGFGQAIANAGDTNVVIAISQNSGSQPQPVRKSLNGKPLPDLTDLGLSADEVPTNKAILLFLFDAGQRPSRAMARNLQERADTLKQQGIVLVGIQVEAITEDAFKQWKDESRISFAVGRVADRKSDKWLSTATALPWLILADDQHRVLTEGFPYDELEKRLTKLARTLAQKGQGPTPSPWTQAPASIRPTAATLNGMVVPNGKPARAWFQWGASTNFENTTPAQDVGSGFGVVRVSAPITGLVPGTVYHARLVSSTRPGVTNHGADLRFTTGMSVIPWGATGNGNCKVPLDLTNAVAIACGHGHSLAIKNDGTVAFWGGEGSFTEFHPNNVPAGLSNIVAIAGGYAQSFALKADGTVVAWGEYLNHAAAKVPEGLNNVIAIAAGDQHAMALKADGTVTVWGNKTSNNETRTPEGLTNVVAIACGSRHCIALKADGCLVEWGDNYPALAPEELENVVAISSEAFRCLALQADGVVLDWGADGFQQLPPGGVNNAIAIGAGLKHSLAALADGTVTVWGNNEWHQLEVPPTLCDVVAVAAGDVHCLALGKLAATPAPVRQ